MNFKELKKSLLSTWSGRAENAKMDFAFQVTDAMKEKQFSEQYVASKLGISEEKMTLLIQGEVNLSIEQLFKIADVFGKTISIEMTP